MSAPALAGGFCHTADKRNGNRIYGKYFAPVSSIYNGVYFPDNRGNIVGSGNKENEKKYHIVKSSGQLKNSIY